MVKILVIGDLHGRMPRIHFKEFDYILCVGDVCSDKDFRPYINKWFKFLKTSEEKLSFKQYLELEIRDKSYDFLIDESILAGRKVLEYLNSFNVPVLFVPGNWDESYGPTRIKDMDKNDYTYSRGFLDFWLGRNSNKKLISRLENVYDLQYRLIEFEGLNFLGYCLISAPENFDKRFKNYDLTSNQRESLLKLSKKIPKRLNDLWKKRNKKVPSIFVSHNVPHGVMDIIYDKKSHAHLKHAGSTVARDFCLKKKPEICVGGHIHEYYGRRKLGETIVVNAGFGRDAQVLLEVKGKKVKVEFVKSLIEKYRKKKKN